MKLIFATLFAALLAACSSLPDYRPQQRSGMGYEEFALSETSYRVHFVGRAMSREKALSMALLRAAELTEQHGYDWFAIDDQHTRRIDDRTFARQRTPAPPIIARDCGLLSCRYTAVPGGFEERPSMLDKNIEAIVQISFGRGVRPAKDHYIEAASYLREHQQLRR